MSDSDLCIPRNETSRPCYFKNIIIMFCLPIVTFIYLWAIYIFPGSVCLFCCSQIGKPILGIYKSLTSTHECRTWERGRAVSFLGIHKSDSWYSVLCKYMFEDTEKGRYSLRCICTLQINSWCTKINQPKFPKNNDDIITPLVNSLCSSPYSFSTQATWQNGTPPPLYWNKGIEEGRATSKSPH